MPRGNHRTSGEGFTNLMEKALSSFERPQVVPGGTFKGVIMPPRRGKSKAKRTPFLQYIVQPVEVVDLEESSDNLPSDWSERSFKLDTLWLTPKAMFAVKEFHTNLGVDVDNPLPEVIQETVGKEVIFTLEKLDSDDGEPYNRVSEVWVD
jgi:energy-coupling factor transporter ATP-binding protein EcfA2